MRPIARLFLGLALAGLVLPARAQDTPPEPAQGTRQGAPEAKAEARTPDGTSGAGPIRNAPSPRALEFAAYIYAASNVCGYRIGPPEFEAQLAKQNVRPADVGPRGPFANRVMGMFTLMSNQMAQNREAACLAVAGEYGPEGSLARNVLLPEGTAPPASAPAAKPAQ